MHLDKSAFPGEANQDVTSYPWPLFRRLNQILAADTAPDTLMTELLAALHMVDEIDACWIGKPDQEGRVLPLATLGDFNNAQGDIRRLANVLYGPFSNCPAAQAWRSGLPDYVEDYLADESAAPWREHASGMRWRSCAAVPLRGRDGPAVLLYIYSNTKGFFPNVWNLDVLRQLAAVIGNALESRQKHLALQRTQRLYQTLFDGAGQLLSAHSEKQVLRLICRSLVDSGRFTASTVGRSGTDGMFRIEIAAAPRHAQKLRRLALPTAQGENAWLLSLRAWSANRTEVENDYARDDRFASPSGVAGLLNIRSAAVMIIPRGGAPWGVLGVSAGEIDYFDQDVVVLLERIAELVGHALDEIDLKAALQEEREQQHLIVRQDGLTQLANRLAFQEQLETALARPDPQGNGLAVGMIDLDDFKQINDSWGQAAGDAVLRGIAGRLRDLMREGDFLARLGGDEFAFILGGGGNAGLVDNFCRRLHDVVTAPLTMPNGDKLRVSLSAGFTLFPSDNATPDLLMRHADMALYAAKLKKNQGRARFWRIFIDPDSGGKGQIQSRTLLEHGALLLHYQPVLNLADGKVTTVEALARLNDKGRLIPPGLFLPNMLLDDRILLFQLVLETALKQLRLWDAEGEALSISINVDAQILLRDDTLPYILDMLARHGVAGNRLVLEILETHDFLDLKSARERLEETRAFGIRLALDDVGAGYSSILKIRELPLDVVKLDRAFVAGLRETPDDLMFVSVIQTLTAALGMELIVEGVETDDVLDALRMIGTARAQGYVIARPMPGPEMIAWLRAHTPHRAGQKPSTLLGAYALHSNWIRAFQFWRSHAPMQTYLRQHNPFSLDEFFANNQPVGDQAREAYDTLQTLLRFHGSDRQLILEADGHFRGKLLAALRS